MSATETTLKPYVLQAHEGEAVWMLANRFTCKATSATTGGALTVLDVLAPAGGTAPWHVHHREDEMFYVIEGTAVFKCGDETFPASAGTFVFLPRGIPHSYKNLGEMTARWLILTTPGGSEGFFIEGGVPAVEEGLRPQPFDPEKLAAVSEKYGVEILGPPPF